MSGANYAHCDHEPCLRPNGSTKVFYDADTDIPEGTVIMHPDCHRDALAAAERRGYDRAVANLRKLPDALFTRQQVIELAGAMKETDRVTDTEPTAEQLNAELAVHVAGIADNLHAELRQLRTRLAEVEAERDRWLELLMEREAETEGPEPVKYTAEEMAALAAEVADSTAPTRV